MLFSYSNGIFSKKVFLVERFVFNQHAQTFFVETWHIPSSAATRNMFPGNILNQVGKKFVIFWIWCDIVDLGFEVLCKTYPVCFLEIETALAGHNCRCDCCMDTGTNRTMLRSGTTIQNSFFA